MLKNYLTVALRTLIRSKGFSLLNLSGLAVGMASATLILLWIHNESTYDNFHANSAHIYQVWNRDIMSGKLAAWNSTPKILGPTLYKEYPGFTGFCRSDNRWFVTSVGDKKMSSHAQIVDSNFLSVFSFPLVSGSPASVLQDPHSIVLTQALSKKLFGSSDPMGQTVKVNNFQFKVTGILQNLPPNTSMDFEFLLPWSMERFIDNDDTNWGNNTISTWMVLAPNVNPAVTETKIRSAIIRHSNYQETTTIFLHPLTKLHLYSEFVDGVKPAGFITTVRLFSIIAAFILLVACINFMNLSTARSEKRAREVGIRKVAGAYRSVLIGQFLGESVLMALLSAVVAFVLVWVSLPYFDTLIGKQLVIPFSNPWFWGATLLFILGTGILAGSYPAFFLSGFRPISVLKGSFRKAHALVNPRKVLVVLQFSFAIVLIICTFIVVQQMRHAQQRDAGYDRGRIVYHWITGDIDKNFAIIRRELIEAGVATELSRTGSPLTSIISDSYGFQWEGKAADDHTDFDRYSEDEALVKTAGLTLIAGRDMDLKQYPTDSTAALLNESAAKAMGFKGPNGSDAVTAALGQTVKDGDLNFHIIGIIKDFPMGSPYDATKPMVIEGYSRQFRNVVNIRLADGRNTAAGIDKIRQVFAKYNPEYPFEYHFTDADFGQKFANTQRIATLTGLFAGLTIFISCLGLFGLAAYMAESRVKEIGVRKVLGASTFGITALLTREFLTLVVISLIIASPIAWFTMHNWLHNYSYHIEISVWVFLVAGGVSVLISLLTVGGQAFAAARSNPAKNLRSE